MSDIYYCNETDTEEEIQDLLLTRNKEWIKKKDGVSDCNDSLRTVVLGCIDSRVPIERIFQTKPGELLVLKNAGNIVTEDVLRSVIASIYEINAKFIIILGHTKCGMSILGNEKKMEKVHDDIGDETLQKLEKVMGKDPVEWFGFFEEGKWVENARAQELYLEKKLEELIPEKKRPIIMSALYDLETGEVKFLREHN